MPVGRFSAAPGLSLLSRRIEELLESLNPLQHMPGVGTIYREATGRAAPIAARILVSTAISGPVGFLGSVASAMLEVTGFVGTLQAIANGRDQPTAFLACICS